MLFLFEAFLSFLGKKKSGYLWDFELHQEPDNLLSDQTGFGEKGEPAKRKNEKTPSRGKKEEKRKRGKRERERRIPCKHGNGDPLTCVKDIKMNRVLSVGFIKYD